LTAFVPQFIADAGGNVANEDPGTGFEKPAAKFTT
jgi:hypothetical protein